MDGPEEQEDSQKGQQQHGIGGQPIGCRGPLGSGAPGYQGPVPGRGSTKNYRVCQGFSHIGRDSGKALFPARH